MLDKFQYFCLFIIQANIHFCNIECHVSSLRLIESESFELAVVIKYLNYVQYRNNFS